MEYGQLRDENVEMEEEDERNETHMLANSNGYGDFLTISSPAETRSCYRNFIDVTLAKALLQEVCVVCMQTQWASEGAHSKQ